MVSVGMAKALVFLGLVWLAQLKLQMQQTFSSDT